MHPPSLAPEPSPLLAILDQELTMAEDQLASKAPENDAAEDSPFPGDSVAQEGPTMGVSIIRSLAMHSLHWLIVLGTLCDR